MRTSLLIVVILGLVSCSKKKDEPATTAPPSGSAGSAAAGPAPAPTPEPTTPPPATASNPDLDQLCAKAKELRAADPGQQRALWSKAVAAISDAKLRAGFDAILVAEAAAQYAMARELAKEAGVSDWTCPDFEGLLSTMK